MIVTLPTNMELLDWAAQVVLDLDPYGAFGRLDREEDWQNWAVQFLNNTTIGRNPPTPYAYEEWRDWAERFCQCLT
jgi:hypothetical protein